MLTDQQIKQLLTENESLQVEVKELNEILGIREEELAALRQHMGDFTALQSRYDSQLDDLGSMQNHIGRQQQEAEGAAGREKELQEELADAYGMKEQYEALFRDYAATQSQLNEANFRLAELKEKNGQLEELAAKAAMLQSELEIAGIEKETLQLRIQQLQAAAGNSDFEAL